MGTERLDKGWQQRGIDTYSIDSILGTLAHYGVTTDETTFKALAATAFPFGIAAQWHETWKGKGQFSHLPGAAAEDLWRRWLPGQLAPVDVTLGLIKLLEALEARLDDRPDEGMLETRFKVVEAFLPSIPPARRVAFIEEVWSALGEWQEPFDQMALALAAKKLDALADRFVALEEALLTERSGVMAAALQAERGDADTALAAIEAIATEPGRDPYNRLTAIDALLDHERLDAAKTALMPMLDDAEQSKDLELVSATIERLAALLERRPELPERRALAERINRIAAAFGFDD